MKVTAWGVDFQEACQRMDRALREFRIRGVKTNIPFLENVVNNPIFQAGGATTRFLDEIPELFRFVPRKDRATKLLSFIGETIVNGNKEVAGKIEAGRPAARAGSASTRRHLAAQRERVSFSTKLGAEGFASGRESNSGCC